MVMVKLSGTITEIEGPSGGDIWRKDQCGQHVQRPPRPIDREPSESQKKRQRAFAFCWRVLHRCVFGNTEIMAYWQDYANKHTKKNKKGETITLIWWQMFISYNINRVVAGEDPDLLPPGYDLIGSVSVWCEQFL